MPRFVPDSRPTAQHLLIEFYREEFLKHHRWLQQQRAYYSESAITDVEAACGTVSVCLLGVRPGRKPGHDVEFLEERADELRGVVLRG